MTDSNYTRIKVIVDRSGSMESCRNDMIGGLNNYFADQAKLPGRCTVDYAQFDTVYDLLYRDMPVADAKAILEPRGMTALLDALGRGIVELGEDLAALPEDERPGTVIVVVVTDGFENASKEWTADRVKDLIKQQEEQYNWTFVFLGANMDAVATGTGLGFSAGSSLTYDTGNIAAASATLSAYTGRVRSGGSTSFTDEERKAQTV